MKAIHKFTAFTLFALMTLVVAAQDGIDIDVDLTDDTPDIFSMWYFWVGVAVVLIILAAIFSRRSK